MAFSDTKKCPDCGTVYHKSSKHTCPYLCPDCGVKVYSDTHSCDPAKIEERLVEKAWRQMGGDVDGPIDHAEVRKGLTPRQERVIDSYLEFYRWCRDNDRP